VSGSAAYPIPRPSRSTSPSSQSLALVPRLSPSFQPPALLLGMSLFPESLPYCLPKGTSGVRPCRLSSNVGKSVSRSGNEGASREFHESRAFETFVAGLGQTFSIVRGFLPPLGGASTRRAPLVATLKNDLLPTSTAGM